MDRINFVILLFADFLHMGFLLAETNCGRRRFQNWDSKLCKKKKVSTYKVDHAASNQEVGDRTPSQPHLVTIDPRSDIQYPDGS